MLTITEAKLSACSAGTRINNRARNLELPLGPGASDDALIEAIARGNRQAMTLLYSRHSVRVYRCSLRITGNAAIAEEIVGDVFLEVWREADRFEARSQVSTWLLAIARNKSLSMLRRRSEEQLEDDVAVQLEDTADDPEVLVCKKDRCTLIRKCLTQLSPAHREVVDLVYYHEKSVDEVAEIVGAPPSTVKTPMFYARQRMAELLKAAGYDDR
jgi:RNA polymerase sigma-70 factor (ECF subfamily)